MQFNAGILKISVEDLRQSPDSTSSVLRVARESLETKEVDAGARRNTFPCHRNDTAHFIEELKVRL